MILRMYSGNVFDGSPVPPTVSCPLVVPTVPCPLVCGFLMLCARCGRDNAPKNQVDATFWSQRITQQRTVEPNIEHVAQIIDVL